jgi:hypothetical protein
MAGFLLFSPTMYPMEDTKMRATKRLAFIPAALAVCGIAAGCFSYHKTEETQPAPVVETAPPAVVAVPEASTSSTTTTTTDAPAVVEQQKTTTYSTP